MMNQKEISINTDKERRRRKIDNDKKNRDLIKQKQFKKNDLPVINKDGDCEYCQGIYCAMCIYSDLDNDDYDV